MAEQAPGVPCPPHHPSSPCKSRTAGPTTATAARLCCPTSTGLCCSMTAISNWSYFKPEFSGKPGEDAEAHLLSTSDWMNVLYFIECVKVQRFCLMLKGGARLWYQSLEPMDVDWQGLQNLFRQ